MKIKTQKHQEKVTRRLEVKTYRPSISFTEEQYKKLKSDQELTGKSLSRVVQDACFSSRKFSEKDTDRLISKVNTVIDGLNAIQQELFKGVGFSCFKNLDDLCDLVRLLKAEIVGASVHS